MIAARTVGFIVPAIVRTGPLNVVDAIVKGIAGRRKVSVASLGPTRDAEFERALRQMGVDVRVFEGAKWNIARVGRFLRRWCDESNVDVISAHGIRPTMLSSFLAAPCVATVHSEIADDFRLEYNRIVARCGASLYVGALRNVAGVVAVSSGVREHIADLGVESVVVPNGVDCSFWRAPTPIERAEARARLGLSGERVIAVVGRLIPRKNPLAAVAAARACLRSDDVVLVVGDGPLRSDISSLRHEDGRPRVRTLGSVHDVRSVLWASDAYLSAALSEGMPMAAIEAVATGLPLFLSDIRSHREIAVHLTKYVHCFGSGAPAPSALDVALEVNRDSVAGAVATSLFAADAMASAYLQQFDAVLGIAS